MIQNVLFKILMAPFSLLYGIGVSLRNTFYKTGVLKSISFNLPIISVGNLSVGGAGKTPHIEYLIRLLKDYLNVATVSRGYKRKTKGFLFVKPKMNAEQVGDEPLQFKRKFQDVAVTVSESRTFAIPEILGEHPDTQVVLLDDAFQHRSIKPGLNILLTEFSKPFTKDFLLPSGRLREWRSAYQRADVVVVSKCPREVTQEEKEKNHDRYSSTAQSKGLFLLLRLRSPLFFIQFPLPTEAGARHVGPAHLRHCPHGLPGGLFK
jgi:tetraacyldisaccharide 4'-kinase